MNCPIGSEEQLGLLEAYCAGERNTPETAVLEQHLAGCAACRELLAGHQAMWAVLDDWNAPDASPDFNRRLFARVEREVSLWDRFMEPFRPLWIRLTVPVAAAASVALMVGLILNHRTVQPPTGPLELSQPDQIEHALDDMQMLHDFNASVPGDNANAKL